MQRRLDEGLIQLEDYLAHILRAEETIDFLRAELSQAKAARTNMKMQLDKYLSGAEQLGHGNSDKKEPGSPGS